MLRLKGCAKCGGDLITDYDDWQCLQCGRYYYSTTPQSYFGREGAWGNADRVAERRNGRKKHRRENKSIDDVPAYKVV